MVIEIPVGIKCPLTNQILKNPVALQCNHTFEMSSLMKKLKQNNNHCPTCGIDLGNNVYLQPNDFVAYSISGFERYKSLYQKILEDKRSINKSEETILPVKSLNVDKKTLKNSIEVLEKRHGSLINLGIKVKESEYRRAVTYVCIIDISGSMSEFAGCAEGNKSFTRLDLVKHVLRVLITSLTEDDFLSIISFSNEPRIEFNLLPMTDLNKEIAKMAVSELNTEGGTYTGNAIKLAYQLMNWAKEDTLKSIILLTDGEDSEGDPVLMRKFDEAKKSPGVQLNTFGFSNGVKSDTLQTLALKGRGTFGFIPDQSMIGTIFVNFLANTFQTFCQDIFIKLSDGYKFMSSKEENKITLQYGRTRNILIKKEAGCNEPLKVSLGVDQKNMYEISTDQVRPDNEFDIQLARYKMLDLVLNPELPLVTIEEYERSNDLQIKEFLEEFRNVDEVNQNNEQIKLSLQYWNSWGAHYLRSFCFAHKLEQCMNFKAPSMKFYRSPHFDDIVGKLTDIFCDLPPPIPTGGYYSHSNGSAINMSSIMDSNNGCILSSCLVKLESGELRKISDLKKGDILENGSKVVCLIKSKYSSHMVKLNDLVITPYHPIIYKDKWRFPIDILDENMRKTDEEIKNPNFCLIESSKERTVCNLVLDAQHKACVEGFECVTLGHGLMDETVRHPYYGSDRVIEELKALNGWEEGLINLDDFKVQRDENGLVATITY